MLFLVKLIVKMCVIADSRGIISRTIIEKFLLIHNILNLRDYILFRQVFSFFLCFHFGQICEKKCYSSDG